LTLPVLPLPPQEVRAVAWLPPAPEPQFLTAGSDGLLAWVLRPEYLEQRALTLMGCADGAPAAAGGFVALCAAPAVAARGGGGAEGEGGTGEEPGEPAAAEGVAFVADAEGGVWRAEVGAGRLLACARVAALPPGEAATALQWAPHAGALAVGTDQGRLLRYRCGSALAGCCGACGGSQPGSAVARPRCGSCGAARPWQLEAQALLDGPVASLCLEPGGLREGVAATAAATAWFVDLEGGERAPLVCGHAGRVELLVAPPAGAGAAAGEGERGDGVVASVAADGVLRVWCLSGDEQVRFKRLLDRAGAGCLAQQTPQHCRCAHASPTSLAPPACPGCARC
jgi:hypothetical protein